MYKVLGAVLLGAALFIPATVQAGGVRVGVTVQVPGVYGDIYVAPRRRYRRYRPHCARRDVHCWWNDDYERVCHRHRRDSCYWDPR